MDYRPPPIRTDGSNAFAQRTMQVRLPAIIRETGRINPDYPPAALNALEALAHGIETDAPIPPLDDPVWAALLARHRGETWQNTGWFFAETYAYRLICAAISWQEAGRDPYAPHKIEEIGSPALQQTLDLALALPPDDNRLAALLLADVWGNRVDLSIKQIAARGGTGSAADLLVDERQIALDHLLSREPGEVHIVLDNAGTELALDLALADALLDGAAYRVILHAKRHPTFVSDATYDDVLTFLAAMTGRNSITGVKGFGAAAKEVGTRLQTALLDGRLLVEPDIYWNSGWFLWEMPPRFEDFFARAALVIFKGDANYRRVVGDALWDAATPFAQVVDYFPAPLLALRTLKSDPIVGLAPGQADQLDAADPDWRTNGTRAVVQFAVK